MFLFEGGVAGHMNHLYDNGDLTFAKLKEIFTAAANGNLVGTEKTDGQNLMLSFSVKDGRAKGVRNKTEIKSGGLNPEELAAKFADRANPALKETFSDALRIFEKTIQGLDKETQIQLFGPDTSIYYNAEVMDPRAPNVIQYDTKNLVIHRAGHAEFDRQTGSKKDTDLSQKAKKLEEIIASSQEKIKDEKYGLQVNAIKKLEGINDKSILNSYINSLNKLLSDVGLKDNSSINEFMIVRVKLFIDDILEKNNLTINSNIKLNIAKKILGVSDLKVTEIYKQLDKEQKNIVKAQIIDNAKNILKSAIMPLEVIVSDFATEMLKGMKSAYILDNSKEVKRLQSEVQKAIDAINNSGNEEAITILKMQLEKLKSADKVTATAEGFVFDYDGVTYKFTGNFAPVNQLLGLFKYGRGNIPAMEKVEEMQTVSEEKQYNIEKIICVYPGRFQPMGKHHVQVFKELQSKFGEDNVYVVTTDVPKKKDPVKSPLNFEEKKKIMIMHGIPSDKIVKTSDPYKAIEVASKFNPDKTALVFAVGQKDIDTRFGTGKITDKSYFQYLKDGENLKPFSKNGYLFVAPHAKVNIEATDDSGKKVNLNIESGTQIRDILSSGDKNLFKAIMGFYNSQLHKLLVDKFKEAKEFVKVEPEVKTKKIKESVIDDIIYELLQETIVKRKNKYCLLSKKTGRNLGCYRSKKEAKKRERQVQYFKHLKEVSTSTAVQGAIGIKSSGEEKNK